jgi:hypothetical protein
MVSSLAVPLVRREPDVTGDEPVATPRRRRD